MIQDAETIARILTKATVLSLDVETDGLDWRHNNSVGYVLTWGPGPDETTYLPFGHEGGGNLDWDPRLMFKALLAPRRDVRLVFFNASFDLKFFYKDGFNFEGMLEDTSINAYLLDENKGYYSLDTCCKDMGVQAKKGEPLYIHMAEKFGGDPVRKAQMGNFWRLSGDDPIAVDYAAGDGTSTWQLWERQQIELDKPFSPNDTRTLRKIWAIECRCIRVLHRMMIRGVKIDEERLDQVRKLVAHAREQTLLQLPPGFNSRAPTQLIKLLTDHGVSGWPTTAKGNPSFTEDWLKTNPIGEKIVRVRKLENLENSFLGPMADRHLWNGRVHTNYNQTMGEEFGTNTGRLSSNEPNLQQVPKRNKELGALFRSIFIPDRGKIWGAPDYSQCEPRLLAHYGHVQTLLRGYRANPPVDAHTAVAMSAGIDRESGKRLNQALITGAGDRKALIMLDRDDAQEILTKYFEDMPEIKALQKTSKLIWQSRGYLVSLLGRKIHLDNPNDSYKAVNRLLQCGNADVLKNSMCNVDEYLYSETRDEVALLNNVHDAFDFQFGEHDRRHYERALEIMQDYGPDGQSVNLDLPLVVETDEGANWAEATYGKTYYWRPDEALPHAAPDLAKAVGSSKVNLAGLE